MTKQEKKHLCNIIREAMFLIVWTIETFFSGFTLPHLWATIIWYVFLAFLIFAFEYNLYKFINCKKEKGNEESKN